MPDLLVVVPSRGRPANVGELVAAVAETCTAGTRLLLVIDSDDPARQEYHAAARSCSAVVNTAVLEQVTGTMVSALNLGALFAAESGFAVGFMGDDHRPRTVGWDRAYLDALRQLGTGIVYGDDLLQGERLPTQCAMTADIVRALKYMAPPQLVHLAVDNWWLALGRAAGCIRYLPDVVVEHAHPVAGKAAWDEGYARVNAPAMYQRDLATFEQLQRDTLPAAAAAVRALRRVPA